MAIVAIAMLGSFELGVVWGYLVNLFGNTASCGSRRAAPIGKQLELLR
jgi:hypothetical protein